MVRNAHRFLIFMLFIIPGITGVFSIPQSFASIPSFSYPGLSFSQPNSLAISQQSFQFTTPPLFALSQVSSSAPLSDMIIAQAQIPTLTEYVKTVQVTYEIIEEKAPSPSPTLTPTPTQGVQVRPPEVLQAQNVLPNPGGLDAEKLFAMSNAYRTSKGLSLLQKDERACALAASRAPEIAQEVSGGVMHSGLRARNIPYWNSENIISMRTEEEAFNWWINDTIHREAIEGAYTYSCVACSGNNCAQEFTNFQAK